MTTATIMLDGGQEATITTDHAASSYGRPVLVYGGDVYGPEDRIPSINNRLAKYVVGASRTMYEHNNMMAEIEGGEDANTDAFRRLGAVFCGL